MNEHEQKKSEEKPSISPLAQEPTYGEKRVNWLFDRGINFWLNLTVSAAFTYWVTHSQKKFTVLGKEFSAPSVLQKKLGKGIHDFPLFRGFGEKVEFTIESPPTTTRAKAAMNLANVFTLVMAGHPIMGLSTWLGAKVKAPMVKWLDRWHYGDEAMDSPELQARHAAIEMEERPTFFGAGAGRVGTVLATQAVGYAIGNSTNLLTWIGNNIGKISPKLSFSFPGMDALTGNIGEKLGIAIEAVAPKAMWKMDNYLAKDGRFSWSTQQLQQNAKLAGTKYTNSARHMGKYLVQDVMYTIVTACSIAPLINYLKDYIPGMTYRPNIRPKDEASRPEVAATARTLHVKPNAIADAAPEPAADAPDTRINGHRTILAPITPHSESLLTA